MTEKPHKGRIENWRKSPCEAGLGYFITGKFIDHPSLHGEYAHTSFVVAHDEATGEIETNNSRYTLGHQSVPRAEPQRNAYDKDDIIRREAAIFAGSIKLSAYRVRDIETGEFSKLQFHMTYNNTALAVMGEEAAKLFAKFVPENTKQP